MASYEEKIRGMTWSYSRAKSFEDCPYKWWLKYIQHEKGEEHMFFSDYGTFIHGLLEAHLKGELPRGRLLGEYIQNFKKEVQGDIPNPNIWKNYFQHGMEYFKTYDGMPFEVLAVEKRVDVEIDGIKFMGFVDVVGRDKDGLLILDHKSKLLKPRNGRKKPSKAMLELDSYLRQPYIYAEAIMQEYGEPVKSLWFNCFRSKTMIREPYNEKAAAEAKDWLKQSVATILKEEEWKPRPEFWKCKRICEYCNICEYANMV